MPEEEINKTKMELFKKRDFLEKEISELSLRIKNLEKEREEKEKTLKEILALKREAREKKALSKKLWKELDKVIGQAKGLDKKILVFENLSLKPTGPKERVEILRQMEQIKNQKREVITKKDNLQNELEEIESRLAKIKEDLKSKEKEGSLRNFLKETANLIDRQKIELERKTKEIKEIEEKIKEREKREPLINLLNQATSLYNQRKYDESLTVFKNIIQEAEKIKEEPGFLDSLFSKKAILYQARKYSLMAEKMLEKQKQTQEEEKKHLRRKELQLLFQKILDYYKKNEVEVATKLLENLLIELENERKKAGFFEKISTIIPLTWKTKRIFGKIQKKKKEGEIRAREVQKIREVEEAIKKQKEEAERAEEIERQKELARQIVKEIPPKPAEIKIETKIEPTLKKAVAVEKIPKGEKLGEEIAEKERELEKQKAEIEEKYKQEIERIKKIMEKRWIEELKEWEEKLKTEEAKKKQEMLRKMEEELKSREEEIKEMQRVPTEVLTEEEKIQRREAILIAEEEIKERRRMIEEETKKIEQEEMKKEQIEEKPEELVFKEEISEEKEKRRALLKEEIRKVKEMMAPEEKEREQKEKTVNLKRLFDEAIFHYKEKNFDRAIEIFQSLKKELPEPKKEPGFFSRIFGKIPLYIQIEDYISRIEKEKILEERRIVREIREQARIASGKKRKEELRFLSKFKKIASKLIPPNPLVIFRKFLFLPPLVAIDISDYSIELLHLNKKLSILTYGRSILKEGVISEGKIKNQKELSQAFKLAVNQAGFKPFRPRQGPILRGIVSIPEYQANVQTFTFESRENIFEKIKAEIEKIIPFPIDELYWDYLETWDEKLNKSKVLVVSALKDIIDGQIYFLKSCGVEPVVFDLEAASVGRALLPEKIGLEKASILILDIGAKVTNINIFDENGFIDLSTAISYGGNYLIEAIAKYFGSSKEEAETIMNIKGFLKEDNIIFDVLEKSMEKIVEETREVIKHYQRKTGNEIKKIILSGGTALLPDIDKFFQSRFQGIEIEIGDPLKKIKRKGGLDSEKAILYTNSIGLALRSITKDPLGGGINLLPGKIKEKEKKIYWQSHRQKLIVIRTLLAILLIVALLLIFYLTYFRNHFKI